MQQASGLSEHDKEIIRNKSDHVFTRLRQGCLKAGIYPPKATFWENLKKLVRESGCADEAGRFEYAVTHLTPQVDALYNSV